MLLQALDVWAMGVTLYCFVFGMVSFPVPVRLSDFLFDADIDFI